MPHDGRRADDARPAWPASIAWSKPWKFIIWPTAISNLHFALLTDFRDAAAGSPAGGRGAVAASAGGRRDAEPEICRRPDRHLLSLSPAAPLECRGRAVDGLRAQARQARRSSTPCCAAARGECFSAIVGDTAVLPAIKYVITLDTDTQLPRDAARRLVGTMAHPLNRPQFDRGARRLSPKATASLQPRVGVSLPSARRSWFVRLFAGDAGIDPYTRAVSDVYQDLFQEGSFIGKGIYDVDAFEQAMAGRSRKTRSSATTCSKHATPARAWSATWNSTKNIPSRYNVDISRRHRWIRGDWQIAHWLLPRVPGADARRMANPLSGLSQWKIFDNLRRSLVPIALLVSAAGQLAARAGTRRPADAAGRWAIIALPGLLSRRWSNLCSKPADLPWAMHLRGARRPARGSSAQIFFTLVFLPYDAFISLDAIGRTLCAFADHAQAAAGMADRPAKPNAGARTDLAGFFAHHVDRAGRRAWCRPVLLLRPAGQLPLAAAAARALARCAVDCLVDQPAHCRADAGLTDEQIGVPADAPPARPGISSRPL